MPGIEEQEFLIKFKQEAEEHLQGLDSGLLVLESDPQNKGTVNELLRLAHTLKGAARMVGLSEIGELAHKIENTFEKVRDEGVTLGSGEISSLFQSLDNIKELLEKAVLGKEEIPETAEFCIVPKPSVESENTKTAQTQEIKERGIGSAVARGSIGVEDASSAERQKKESGKTILGRRLEDRQATIRVKTERLDGLVGLASEMIISNMQIQQDHKKLKEVYQQGKEGLRLLALLRERLQNLGGISLQDRENLLEEFTQTQNSCLNLSGSLRGLHKSFAENIARASAVTQDLQQEVLDVRMLPISIIFDDIPRAIRDMSLQFGKLISLRISGGGTELDKKMLEELRDPVIHLIRNAVDHGIETTEERERKGKPREGAIEISAWHEGDRVAVEIKDDGAGIDWQEVKQTAVEKGFIRPEVVNELGEHELMDLLFLPGFSTSKIITDLSGRGVGLDVVKGKIEDLKGTASIVSERDRGSTVRLEIPLTLAIQRVLLVKVGGEILALPTASVEETLTLSPEQIRTIEGRQAVLIREKIIPLVSLAEILGLNGSSVTDNAKLFTVLVAWGNHKVAFLVNQLVGEQEAVIKSLGSHLTRVKNIAAATILGSGEVIVILNIPDLIESARSVSGNLAPPEVQQNAENNNHHFILVVEDSLTTREMERSILEASGYEVDIAVDGIEALEKAARKKYDLFVVDILMPRMDGFQLTERLRGDKMYKEVPIVIVTSREKEKDKRRGIDIGANAYIVKRQFDQSVLLDTVSRLIG